MGRLLVIRASLDFLKKKTAAVTAESEKKVDMRF